MAIAALLLQNFDDPNLNEQDLLARLAWLRDGIAPRLERFLGYYRNPTSDLAAGLPCPANAFFAVRPFRQYQEIGLPARITGFRRAADGGSSCGPTGNGEIQRKEVVIENDIAWRMDTLVDFAAGRMPAVSSTAADSQQRAKLTPVVAAILETAAGRCGGSGCGALLQELTLQGVIAGSAWVHIRPTEELLARLGTGGGEIAEDQTADGSPAMNLEHWLKLEVMDARVICPLPQSGGNACQSSQGPAYVAVLRGNGGTMAAGGDSGNSGGKTGGFLQRVRSWFGAGTGVGSGIDPEQFSFDLFGTSLWQRYENGVLVEEGENPLGVVPFVRYENAPDPAAGTRVGAAGSAAVDTGLGDVEPLIGLQDELNTRLSDRAYRVTMSSFRMFLGKGIEDFIKRPIGPGQMWGTDNPDATIESFGGDQATPSEESHISEVRQALDKVSGVPPVAAGILEGKVGNLTSAVALQITLIALLARTQRKRIALTETISELVRTVLAILDAAGIVQSAPDERGVDVNWPTALPESDMEQLTEAQMKLSLGIPRNVVLTELGYADVVAAEQAGGTETSKPAIAAIEKKASLPEQAAAAETEIAQGSVGADGIVQAAA